MSKVKVTFRLAQDEDGYPPYAVEDLWATGTDISTDFVIDSIPFFARVALGDRVRVIQTEQGLEFGSVIACSSNSLIRVIVYDADRIPEVREHLRRLGCSSEGFKGLKIVAVNVPAEASLVAVQNYLQQLKDDDAAGYEEPILRQ